MSLIERIAECLATIRNSIGTTRPNGSANRRLMESGSILKIQKVAQKIPIATGWLKKSPRAGHTGPRKMTNLRPIRALYLTKSSQLHRKSKTFSFYPVSVQWKKLSAENRGNSNEESILLGHDLLPEASTHERNRVGQNAQCSSHLLRGS